MISKKVAILFLLIVGACCHDRESIPRLIVNEVESNYCYCVNIYAASGIDFMEVNKVCKTIMNTFLTCRFQNALNQNIYPDCSCSVNVLFDCNDVHKVSIITWVSISPLLHPSRWGPANMSSRRFLTGCCETNLIEGKIGGKGL